MEDDHIDSPFTEESDIESGHNDVPGFKECRDRIMAILENDPESRATIIDVLTTNEVGLEDISQNDTETGRTIIIRSEVPSSFPPRTMDEIVTVAKQHDMKVKLEAIKPIRRKSL